MGSLGILHTTTRPFRAQFPWGGVMNYIITEPIFDSQATWVIDVHGVFLDKFSMCIFTREFQAFNRLVQELNICNVEVLMGK